MLIHIGVSILIFLAVYLPNPKGVLAQIFAVDRYNHLDAFIMSPGWAFLKGAALNVDNYSQYGLGMPIVLSLISKALNGLTYENVLLVLVGLTIVYLITSYFFVLRWSGNIFIAIAGTLLILKFYFFNFTLSDPIIWRHPSQTVIRYLWDIGVFMFILRHLQTRRIVFLFLAAVVCGIAVFYVTDTGLYLLGAFLIYLALGWMLGGPQFFGHNRVLVALACTGIPMITALGLTGLAVGKNVFQGIFWQNMSEFPWLTRHGWGAVSAVAGLQEGRYFNFAMAAVIVAGYLMTVLFVSTNLLLRRSKFENVLAVILGVYGLGLFHYQVVRSTSGAAFAVCIPFIFLVCYWADIAVKALSLQRRKMILPAVCAFAFILLLATPKFQSYPNLFRASKISFAKAMEDVRQQEVPQADIDLIRKWTSAQDQVCLISNFDALVLMKSDRRPFLYYIPFVFSRSLTMRDFGDTSLFTYPRLQKTLEALETEKPQFVFIEENFWGRLPPPYYQHFQTLTILIKYFSQHYRVHDRGHYLIALKRNTD